MGNEIEFIGSFMDEANTHLDVVSRVYLLSTKQ